ncbi:MAG: DUF2283 domain-containing protein [Planctomycetes bacterium]|nr:DUF2283 domain-containing protein [Planctomycetota bacterium]
MRVAHGARADTLTIEIKPGPVAESDEDKPDVIVHYDADGTLVDIQVLDASRRVDEARIIQFQVAG